MATQDYLGGYVDPETGARFRQRASAEGVSQQALLNDVLTNYLDAQDAAEEDPLDRLPTGVGEEVNALIIQAWDEHPADEGKAAYYTQLVALLRSSIDEPREFSPDDHYWDILPDHLASELDDLLRTATDDEPPHRDALLDILAHLIEDEHLADAGSGRRVSLTFTEEEAFYLDRFLDEINEDRGKDTFPDLAAYLRFKLGELMEYAGTGFLIPEDKGMLEMGRRLKEAS